MVVDHINNYMTVQFSDETRSRKNIHLQLQGYLGNRPCYWFILLFHKTIKLYCFNYLCKFVNTQKGPVVKGSLGTSKCLKVDLIFDTSTNVLPQTFMSLNKSFFYICCFFQNPVVQQEEIHCDIQIPPTAMHTKTFKIISKVMNIQRKLKKKTL